MVFTSQLAKAAVVLNNLPTAQSRKIMDRLESTDLRTVFQAINELDMAAVRPFFEALDELARESQKEINRIKPARSAESPIAGNSHQLADAADNPFGFLFARSIGDVADLLADEHPREIAVVLTQLPKDTAASLLQQFEPVHRVAVVRRLCDPSAVKELDRNNLAVALKQRLNKLDRRRQTGSSQKQMMSEILDQLGHERTLDLAEQVGGDAPLLDAWVRQNSRSFVEFRNCSPDRIRRLFDQTDPALWSSALRECDAVVRQHILKSLKPSDSRMVGRQMLDLTGQVAPPGNIAQHQLADALAAMQ